MKTLWNILAVLLLLHFLILVGAGAWLYSSGRISKDRLKHTLTLYRSTLAEEEARAAELARTQEGEKRAQEEEARKESVAKGPLTPMDRIAADQREDELLRQRLDRLERERRDLLRQIDKAKDALAKQKTELDQERKVFDGLVAEESRKRDDQDFQAAVQMYEQLKPKQAKEMLQELLRQNQAEQVVAYLAAMQLRKSAAVLKEFKTATEIQQATELVQRLRKRGVDLKTGPAPALSEPSETAAENASAPTPPTTAPDLPAASANVPVTADAAGKP